MATGKKDRPTRRESGTHPPPAGSAAPYRAPTIRDVAARAGVSKSLVSLVMRDSPRVSEKSRTAVKQAAKELGYRPNAMARSLVSRHSRTLGIVASNAHDVFYASVLDGVAAYSRQMNYVPLIVHGDHEPSLEAQVVNTFLELQVDALLLMGSSLPAPDIEDIAREVPVVIVGRLLKSDRVDVVVNDDTAGAALATNHLIQLGHRRIAHFTGGNGNGAAEREASFRTVMEEHGFEPIVIPAAYLQEPGAAAARTLMERPGELPTAVFAANDLNAIGAGDVFRKAGLRIPQDLSLVGYDNTPLARLYGIELTTIDQPAEEMGRIAAQRMCSRLTEPIEDAQLTIIPPSLVERSSTGPPPAT